MLTPSNPVSSLRWLPVKNNSGYAVPPFGLMRITGIDDDTKVLTIDKPNADSQSGLLVNGPAEIADDDEGIGTDGGIVVAAYDDADGTPAADEGWGAKSGEWKLRKDKVGYTIIGSASDGAVVVRSSSSGTTGFTGTRRRVISVTCNGDGSLSYSYVDDSYVNGLAQ
jgi:hypothetical protein